MCTLEEKCLFVGMESFDLVDITAIIPEGDHLVVRFLVVWLGAFIGKDDNLMKFEDRKRNTQIIMRNCFLPVQFHNSMQQ